MPGPLGACDPCGVMGTDDLCWWCHKPWTRQGYAQVKAAHIHIPTATEVQWGGRYGPRSPIDPEPVATLVD